MADTSAANRRRLLTTSRWVRRFFAIILLACLAQIAAVGLLFYLLKVSLPYNLPSVAGVNVLYLIGGAAFCFLAGSLLLSIYVITQTHRLLGALRRIHTAIVEANDGQRKPIALRQGDQLGEMAEELNRLLAR